MEDLLVDDVLAFLRSKFVLDSEDTEVIRVQKTSHRQAEKLLDILPQKGYEAFEHFFSALSDKYPHLAKLLQSGSKEEQFQFIFEAVDSPLQCEYELEKLSLRFEYSWILKELFYLHSRENICVLF